MSCRLELLSNMNAKFSRERMHRKASESKGHELDDDEST